MSSFLLVVLFTLLYTINFITQLKASTFDFTKHIEYGIENTIKRDNINCSNYDKFCEKINDQFETNNDPKNISVNLMAISLCKAILQIYVCKENIEI